MVFLVIVSPVFYCKNCVVNPLKKVIQVWDTMKWWLGATIASEKVGPSHRWNMRCTGEIFQAL